MIDLEDLSNYVAFAATLQKEIEELDAAWKEKTARLRRLLEEDIPSAMDELGMQSINTAEFTINVDDDWKASIPQYKRDDVCNYAVDLGAKSLITHEISMKFKKDEDEFFDQVCSVLDQNQIQHNVIKGINTSSWKKFVRERAAQGGQVDLERACVERVRKATIKRKDSE